MTRPNRFLEFVKRHETKSYGTPIDQPLIDTRLDNSLSAAGRATSAYFVPNALPPDDDEAVVMAVLPRSAGMMSSYDPNLGLVADIDKTQEKMFDLKCYVISRPTTVHMNLKKLSVLDPMYVSLLPTFKATVLEGSPEPERGDVVVVRYDNLTHTKGDYIKTTGINISDMFSENISDSSLVSKFNSSTKKTGIGEGETMQELAEIVATEKDPILKALKAQCAAGNQVACEGYNRQVSEATQNVSPQQVRFEAEAVIFNQCVEQATEGRKIEALEAEAQKQCQASARDRVGQSWAQVQQNTGAQWVDGVGYVLR